MLVDYRGLEGALEAVRMSVEAVRVSVEAVRVSIEALRCFRGRERLEEVPENAIEAMKRPLLTLSQSLKHSQGLCSLQALNWLVIGNSQVLSHGCESVVEAVRVLYTHSSATVS